MSVWDQLEDQLAAQEFGEMLKDLINAGEVTMEVDDDGEYRLYPSE